MDDKIQNDIPEYIRSLPKEVQDLIFDGVWEERTLEISRKYTLTENQTDTLADNVLLVLIGLEKPDLFLDTVIADLNISRLLAEQIQEDLEARVFEYTLNFIESRKSKVESRKVETLATSKISMSDSEKDAGLSRANVPEIKPDNLPAIEPSETVHTNVPKVQPAQVSVPQYVPSYKPTSAVLNEESLQKDLPKENPTASRINYAPRVTPEPVQKPVSVPRYTAVPIEEEEKEDLPTAQVGKINPLTTKINEPVVSKPAENTIQNPSQNVAQNKINTPAGIMENKLNNVTKSTGEVVKPPPPPQKYSADPYREPLE